MASSQRFLLFCLVLFLAGCGQTQSATQATASRPIAAQATPVRIVVLGSSTAAGTGPSDPANAWVNRFRAYLQDLHPGNEVINIARGGYTTYHLVPTGRDVPAERPEPDPEHNITRALSLQPTALVINLPSNDAARGYGVAEQMANYEAILDVLPEGLPVWVATPQPRNFEPEKRQIQRALKDATWARFGGRTLDFWTGIARRDASIAPVYDSGDGIHLNDLAHQILFAHVVVAGLPAGVAGEPGP